MVKRIIIICLLAGLAVCAAAQNMDGKPAAAKDTDIPGLGSETWYRLIFMGQEAGYLHISQYRSTWEGAPVIIQYTETHMNLRRFNQKTESSMKLMTILTEDLKPWIMIYDEKQSHSAPVHRQARVSGPVLEVVESAAGDDKRVTLELPKDFALDFQMNLRMLEEGLAPGWKKTYTSFNLSDMSFSPSTIEVLDKKRVEFEGKTMEVTPVRTVAKLGSMILDNVEWLDAAYNSLYIEEKNIGLRLERTTREQVLQSGAGLDIDRFSSVVPDKKIPHSPRVVFLKLKISLNRNGEGAPFPEDDRQHYTPRGDGGLLEVTCRLFAEADSSAMPPETADTADKAKEDLGPTGFLQTDDPGIISQARTITGGEKNAWRASIKILRWLRGNIKPSFRMAMLSAKEVLEKREGDCTEYAVLFAALARAAGIPARVNIGLVYFDGRFMFHAWNEVYVGRWVPIDAALNQVNVDATHLKVYSGGLGSPEEMYTKIMRIIGRMKIEVVECRNK